MGQAIKTNGLGKHYSGHLNFTVTLADYEIGKRATPKRRYERTPKIPYAGKENNE